MTTPYAPDLPATAQQQLWTIDAIEGWFGTKEGGEVSGDVTKIKDGGSLDDLLIPGGTPSTSNLTLTKLYRPLVHGPTLRELEKQVLRYRTTITGYDADPDLGPLFDTKTTYAGALLVRVKRPDHDANSSDSSMFELEFAVTRAS